MYDSPCSLQDVCATYISSNIEAFCEVRGPYQIFTYS